MNPSLRKVPVSNKGLLFILIISLLVSSSASYFYFKNTHRYSLNVDIAVAAQTDIITNSQVFFDTGNGYNQSESQTVPLSCDKNFYHLSYKFPADRVRRIRFDFMTIGGEAIIKNLVVATHNGVTTLRLTPENISLTHQIEKMVVHDDKIIVTTVPNANDPSLQLDFMLPFFYHSYAIQDLALFAIILFSLFFFGIMFLLITCKDGSVDS